MRNQAEGHRERRGRSICIRTGTLLCPAQHATNQRWYLADLHDYDGEKTRRLIADAFAHLRRHGALPLFGLALFVVSAAMVSFTYANPALHLVIGLATVGVTVVIRLGVPPVTAVRGGCPYALDPAPAPLRPGPLLAIAAGITGALALVDGAMVPVQNGFDLTSSAGIVAGGACLLWLGWAATGNHIKWFSCALWTLAISLLLIAIGDIGSATFAPTTALSNLANWTAASGAIIYAIFVRDLTNLYRAPNGTPAEPTTLRRHLAA